MFYNYFKTAWRNLWRQRFYTSINIFGLAIGLAVGIIILLWTKDELSFDRFHAKKDHIYRVIANMGSGGNAQSWQTTPAPISVYGKKEVPEVKDAARFINNWDYSIYKTGEKQFTDLRSAYVDPSFFNIFDFKFEKGNLKNPFPDINSVLLTESTAKKFFGSENPIGKVIIADNKDNFVVQGILADVPSNSSLKFDMLFPVERLVKAYQPGGFWKSMNDDWGNYYCFTFFLMHDEASLAAAAKKINTIHNTHHPSPEDDANYTFQPLTQIHLYEADGSSSAMQSVQLFFGVAVLLLLIACINYVNLSTARSMLRAREVSVRKIIGAARKQLFAQFVLETAILFAIATALAIVIIYLLMPVYNQVAGKKNNFDITHPDVWITIGITIMGTLVAASIYPALLLSSFQPIQALKGKIKAGVSNILFRRVLVVTQFAFSVALIIGTIVIGKQLHYINSKQPGYDRSHVFQFDVRDMDKHLDAVKAELKLHPRVKGVASANGSIVEINSTTGDTEWDGKPEKLSFLIHPLFVDAEFMSLMKLQLVAGTGFTGSPADSSHYILNETAIRETGIKDPIGKSFSLWERKGTIIGVVKDFHYASLRDKIEPAVLQYRPDNGTLYVKTNGKDAAGVIAAAERLWKQYNPGFPFEYRFLDETFDRMYRSEQRTGTLFNYFAGIAILISCLGLFGLAAYTAQIKTREIGIRKVLGATVTHVTQLLASDFLKLVLIAIVVASPVAWFVMNKWLQNFAYRADISWWVFAVAGLTALLIALLTVSFQAIKAALVNPVNSLKNE